MWQWATPPSTKIASIFPSKYYFYARVVILVAFGRKRRLGMFDL